MVLGARQWRGGALALALGLLPLGCAGDYPLPPTRCDDLCNATQGDTCELEYDPAGCVVSCEAGGFGAEGCVWAFEPAMACLREHPEAVWGQCIFSDFHPCQTEFLVLAACGTRFAESQTDG